jgi:hypothetical protein
LIEVNSKGEMSKRGRERIHFLIEQKPESQMSERRRKRGDGEIETIVEMEVS